MMLRNALSPEKRTASADREEPPVQVSSSSKSGSGKNNSGKRRSLSKEEAASLKIREKLLRKEREQRAAALQNKQRILRMVHKRLDALAYLRKVLIENYASFWLGTTKIHSHELNEGFQQNESLLSNLYCLAYSIFAIDDNTALKGLSKVAAFSQLLEEWEYHRGGQSDMLKYVMAHSSESVNPSKNNTPSLYTNTAAGGANDDVNGENREVMSGSDDTSRISLAFKTVLYKFNGVCVFEYLQTPHVPLEEIGNAQVMESFNDALILLYNSFLDPEVVNATGSYDALQKRVDAPISKHYLTPYMTEISQFATMCMKNELNGLAGGGTLGL